ncbi:MAG: hypothetical protein E6G17_03540 [Actinobacteria bacterium]|nr:MAG: hypothetical protein E6G17_03540 [Actinomycetota bacterium]
MEGAVNALSQDVIRSLAAFRGHDAPVVSLYLDVDGRRYVRPKEYELRLDALVRHAQERGNGGNGVAPAGDLARVEQRVKQGVDRSHTRGLAIFSCAAHGLWEVLELPVPVRNQLVVNQVPYVRQLEVILAEHERICVLLADRQRARMLVVELGQPVDRSEVFDELPRHEDDTGDWERDHVRDHAAAVVQRHLRRTAAMAFTAFQRHGFAHLVVAAADEIAPTLEAELHDYLRQRIVARLVLPVSSTEAVILDAVQPVEIQIERAREEALSGKGVAGLPGVLGALVERRVETLLVSDGYDAPGWRCGTCGNLGVRGRACPACGARMEQLDDVVEEAVEEALKQSCRVVVCVGNADLDVQGRIAALLRF